MGLLLLAAGVLIIVGIVGISVSLIVPSLRPKGRRRRAGIWRLAVFGITAAAGVGLAVGLSMLNVTFIGY